MPCSTGFSTILCGHSFKRPYSQNDLGVDGIFGPLELSNDVNFVEILVKTAENTCKPPYKFAYKIMSHDRDQSPLGKTILAY